MLRGSEWSGHFIWQYCCSIRSACSTVKCLALDALDVLPLHWPRLYHGSGDGFFSEKFSSWFQYKTRCHCIGPVPVATLADGRRSACSTVKCLALDALDVLPLHWPRLYHGSGDGFFSEKFSSWFQYQTRCHCIGPVPVATLADGLDGNKSMACASMPPPGNYTRRAATALAPSLPYWF